MVTTGAGGVGVRLRPRTPPPAVVGSASGGWLPEDALGGAKLKKGSINPEDRLKHFPLVLWLLRVALQGSRNNCVKGDVWEIFRLRQRERGRRSRQRSLLFPLHPRTAW
jgi:hypothetical protein